jgi:hypothetical protein
MAVTWEMTGAYVRGWHLQWVFKSKKVMVVEWKRQ